MLTDHSQSLTIANGLTPARVEEQRRIIAELNERYAREEADGEAPEGSHPDGFRLLHGTEMEIRVDGRLDYDDRLLERYDVVVASLHVGRRQPREQLMARYMTALHNPNVDIIAHPSGRKIGIRPDLDLDWDAFYRTAAETGTLLEINGSDERLDLDDRRIRAALDAGVTFTIDSDAHYMTEWDNVKWGIGLARRAGSRNGTWPTRCLASGSSPRLAEGSRDEGYRAHEETDLALLLGIPEVERHGRREHVQPELEDSVCERRRGHVGDQDRLRLSVVGRPSAGFGAVDGQQHLHILVAGCDESLANEHYLRCGRGRWERTGKSGPATRRRQPDLRSSTNPHRAGRCRACRRQSRSVPATRAALHGLRPAPSRCRARPGSHGSGSRTRQKQRHNR